MSLKCDTKYVQPFKILLSYEIQFPIKTTSGKTRVHKTKIRSLNIEMNTNIVFHKANTTI